MSALQGALSVDCVPHGVVDTDVFSRLLRKVLERDVAGVLDIVEDLVIQGRELTQLAADFTWYLRNLLLVKTSDNIEDVLDVSTENMLQLKEESKMIELDMLLRYIRIFSELSGQLKYATQKRVLLEVALIKLCTPAMETGQDALLDRIRAVEEKVEKGLAAAADMPQRVVYVNGDDASSSGSGVVGSRKAKTELPNAIPEDVQEVVKNFRSIADEASGMIRGFLKKARLSLGGDNRLLIVLPDAMSADMVGREDHVQELEQLIEEKIGKKVEVDVRHVEEGRHFEDTFVDIEQKINMEIKSEPQERIFNELQRALKTKKPSVFFRSLVKADLLEILFPEIYALIGKTQPVAFHPEGDAFEHTMEIVDLVAGMTDDVAVRFAGLVHDLGKGVTPTGNSR